MSHLRTWVEVSRGALRSNWQYVRGRVPAASALCAVVKADAYGHGALSCARVFAGAGAPWMAVTSVEEGVRLRLAGLKPRILILGGFTRDQAPVITEHQLTPAVWDAGQVAWLAEAGAPIRIHVKLETGMGRLGVTAEQWPGMTAALAAAPQIEVEAVFSHLAASEASDPAACGEQHTRLVALAARLHRPWHLLNSEGALRFPEWSGMMTRVGLALYGYSLQADHAPHLTPALHWKTRILAIKDLPANHGVGYGPRFRTSRPSRVATLSAGYADGYRRDYAPQARVLIAGRPAPVIGAISMDLTTVDVTDISGASLGDEVTLLGPGLSANELAGWAQTIPYEVLCGISARVIRLYVD